MTDPVMVSVASAVAGKAAEAATESGKAALAALIRFVRHHLSHSGEEEPAPAPDLGSPGDPAATPELPTGEADDPAAVRALAAALDEAAAADPDFGARVRELWQQARTELSAQGDGVINTNTGTVTGHLLQARDLNVQGGLHLS